MDDSCYQKFAFFHFFLNKITKVCLKIFQFTRIVLDYFSEPERFTMMKKDLQMLDKNSTLFSMTLDITGFLDLICMKTIGDS